MKRIIGFRMRHQKRGSGLPKAFQDVKALNRLIEKVRAMGESFFTMSEEKYGDWLDSLPQDEFIELIALK